MNEAFPEATSMQEQCSVLIERSFQVGAVSLNYRPIVGWAMNDRLVPEILTEQLHSFKRMGFGGVMLIPWAGCPYEVMSDEWMDMVGHILFEAKSEGLEVWIWDDWIFPSGPAGGVVTRDNNNYKSKSLHKSVDIVLEPGEEIEIRIPERSLAAAVFPVDKFNNPSGLFNSLHVIVGQIIHHKALTRERLVVVCWQYISAMQHTTKSQIEVEDIYTGNDMDVFSVDMLNPAATQRFIEVIHQRYYDRYADFFGNTLKGFFYDEPSMPSIYPWTDGFLEAFQRIKGYDLQRHLVPMLVEYKIYDITFDLQNDEIKGVRSDFFDVWSSVSAEAFFGQVQQWCQNHSVINTGHLSCDESLTMAVSFGGHYFKYMAYNDLPGGDVVFNQLTLGEFFDSPRFAGSRAAVMGKSGALSESFAATGHGIDLDFMRYTVDHQIIRGITKFFTKIANYNPVKGFHFHPPELSAANLIMNKYGRHLLDRTANLCALMGSGSLPTMVALCVPLENYYLGDTKISGIINEIARSLTYNQREFAYVWDADILEMTMKDNCLLSSGRQRFSHIIIPPGTRFTYNVCKHLSSLAKSGCRIISWGDSPSGLDSVCRPLQAIEQILELTKDATRPFDIHENNFPVSLAHRILSADRHLIFLLNESCEPQSFTFVSQEPLKIYEMDVGNLSLSIFDTHKIDVHLRPSESRMLMLDNSLYHEVACFSVLDENAVIVIDDWELELPDGQLVMLSTPLPSWNELGYAEYHGTMRYRTSFTWSSHADNVVLSLGDIRYAATVFLDGKPVGDCVFTPFSLSLSGLHQGEHTIEIDVLNTRANLVCGTEMQTRRLEATGALKGTFAPILMPLDQKRILSGMLGPVTLTPVV